MELTNFYALLKRYRNILIAIPVITVLVTYFLVRKLPDAFTSQAQIATGLVDKSQQSPDITASQESQVIQEFSNMITTMEMKTVVNQVSYKLMLHDLTTATPFRKPSKEYKELNPDATKHAIDVFNTLYKTRQSLSLWDPDQNGLNKVMASMKYDAASLTAKIVAYRAETSDFIHVEYESENPQLSAFVVNTLISEFIDYYTSNSKENQLKTVSFLDNAVIRKKAVLDSANNKLRLYKIDNHILNLNEQAKSLYTQIADFETRKEQAEKDVIAYTGSLKNIDSQFNPNDKRYKDNSLTKVAGDILATREKLRSLTDQYVRSNMNDLYRQKIDSVKAVLTEKTNESADKSIYSPATSNTSLMERKLTLSVDLDIAKFSIKSLTDEIDRLHKKLDVLVPSEAVIQSLESAVDVAQKDYLELLQKDNQATMQSNLAPKLHQVDIAMPGAPQASKKMLLVATSGVASAVLCLLVMFGMFYMDKSIKHPIDLANKTGLPVLGHINTITGPTLDLKKLWGVENRNKMQDFKDLLRSIRFEIDQELQGSKILAVTSLSPGEGKTLLAISLAYSYSIINKKVLLIDGNLENPAISTTVQPKIFIEDYFKDNPLISNVKLNNTISVMGNKGSDLTLLEIENEQTISRKFEELRSMYDIIVIEIPAMDTMNKAKEWLLFADKIIGVFEDNKTLDDTTNKSVQYLKSLGPKFSGWIFNKATPGNIK